MSRISGVTELPGKMWRGWLSRSGADLLIVPVLLGLHLLLTWAFEYPTLLGGIPVTDRPGLYSAAAVVVSLTGTLASVTVAQFLGGRGERMLYLKKRFPGSLAKTWRAIFLGSVVSVVLFLTAYGFDSRTTGWHIGTWLFEAGAILAALRFVRLAMLFGTLVEVIVLDDTDPLAGPSFEFNPDFFEEPKAAAGR